MTVLGRDPRPRRRRFAVLAVAALALPCFAEGCASPGLASRQRTLEAAWQASGPANDSLPSDDPFEGVPVFTRDALVRAVLARNPTLRAARYAWRAALARYPQETSLDDPMLGLGLAPASFGSDSVDEGYRVEASQRLPFPGKRSLRGEIALAEAEAAASDFDAVRLRLATLASLLFDEYYVAERSLEINREHSELLTDFRRIASARYEAGEAPQQAPLQAEVEQAHLLHQAAVLETARRVTREQLNLLLHRRAGLPLPAAPQSLELPPPDTREREALVERALAARPESRAAQARLAGRESALALARREFLPDFTLIGAYDRIWQETDLQPFVGMQIEVPLRVARRRAAVDEAHALLERAESQRVGTEDRIRFDVETGLARLHEARHLFGLYESHLLPAAQDQVQAARAGFETGTSSFLELIEAERNLRTLRLEHEEARADVSRRHAELERALGEMPELR